MISVITTGATVFLGSPSMVGDLFFTMHPGTKGSGLECVNRKASCELYPSESQLDEANVEIICIIISARTFSTHRVRVYVQCSVYTTKL